jgi:hypothetical protein
MHQDFALCILHTYLSSVVLKSQRLADIIFLSLQSLCLTAETMLTSAPGGNIIVVMGSELCRKGIIL